MHRRNRLRHGMTQQVASQGGTGIQPARLQPQSDRTLVLLEVRLAICRLAAGAEIPNWAFSGQLSSVTRTAEEMSIVCAEDQVPAGVRHEAGWRAIKVAGTFDIGLTGILESIARPLAEAGVSIFALSTFDTDYVLVKDASLEVAIKALKETGLFQFDGHEH